MNALTLALASIQSRALVSWLSVIAAAAGITLLAVVFLLSGAVQDGITRNSKGIDIVVGAKGSPTQLILSSVYHSDVPNGNIEMKDYEQLSRNPQIIQIIPLAIGDNYKGSRVIGTTLDYLSHYGAVYAGGRVFNRPFEAVAGSLTGLKVGDNFAARHGFSVDSDDVHDAHLYNIVGVLKPSGTVLDRLITTHFKSVQDLHSHPDHHDGHGHRDEAEETETSHQITAALIKVKNPAAIMNLPREINASTNMLAASPTYQMTRLSQNLGMGRDVLITLAGGTILLSILMLFSLLASNFSARRYDLAVLRVLGASRSMLSMTIIAEALMISSFGAVLGLVIGHGAAMIIAISVPSLSSLVLPQALLMPQILDVILLGIGVSAGLLSSIIPAVAASRTDIASLLAKGKL